MDGLVEQAADGGLLNSTYINLFDPPPNFPTQRCCPVTTNQQGRTLLRIRLYEHLNRLNYSDLSRIHTGQTNVSRDGDPRHT